MSGMLRNVRLWFIDKTIQTGSRYSDTAMPSMRTMRVMSATVVVWVNSSTCLLCSMNVVGRIMAPGLLSTRQTIYPFNRWMAQMSGRSV